MNDDHDRVGTVIADLRDQLGTDGPRCPATFARLRWSLTSDVLRCLALERLRLTRLENTRDLRGRCDQDERTFREHIARWPAAAMQARWHDYASEFRAILRLVEARLREGQEAGSATITPASAQSRQPIPSAMRRP